MIFSPELEQHIRNSYSKLQVGVIIVSSILSINEVVSLLEEDLET